MYCPKCQENDTRVVDSREHPMYNWVKRRRECKECMNRWTTYEVSDHELLLDEDEK